MKGIYVFNHEYYHNALKSQITSPHIVQFNRQRGGGIGNIISGMTQYLIPITRKYVLPEIKSAAERTFDDVIQGKPLTSALLANTKSLIENVGRDIAQSIYKQQGGNITRKPIPTRYTPIKSIPKTKPKPKAKKPKSKAKQQKAKNIRKKTCVSKCKSKRDIFS